MFAVKLDTPDKKTGDKNMGRQTCQETLEGFSALAVFFFALNLEGLVLWLLFPPSVRSLFESLDSRFTCC